MLTGRGCAEVLVTCNVRPVRHVVVSQRREVNPKPVSGQLVASPRGPSSVSGSASARHPQDVSAGATPGAGLGGGALMGCLWKVTALALPVRWRVACSDANRLPHGQHYRLCATPPPGCSLRRSGIALSMKHFVGVWTALSAVRNPSGAWTALSPVRNPSTWV